MGALQLVYSVTQNNWVSFGGKPEDKNNKGISVLPDSLGGKQLKTTYYNIIIL